MHRMRDHAACRALIIFQLTSVWFVFGTKRIPPITIHTHIELCLIFIV